MTATAKATWHRPQFGLELIVPTAQLELLTKRPRHIEAERQRTRERVDLHRERQHERVYKNGEWTTHKTKIKPRTPCTIEFDEDTTRWLVALGHIEKHERDDKKIVSQALNDMIADEVRDWKAKNPDWGR